MANKQMKIFVIRKMHIKTTARNHYTPMRMAKTQNTDITNAMRMWSDRNSHSLLVGMQNGAATLEDSLAVSSRTKHTLTLQNSNHGASLVAQWLRICLPMQRIRVRALVWEDPICRGATGPVSHNC